MAAAKGNKYAEKNSKYDESYNEIARKLCLLGHTDAELALFFDVSEATINNWKKDHPKFFESVMSGKILADVEVAHSLYKGTQDREVMEQQAFKVRSQVAPGVFEEEIKIVDVKRVIPADFRNQQFWLKNRQSGKWRDKHDVTLAGDKENPVQAEVTLDYKSLTDEQLRNIAAGKS